MNFCEIIKFFIWGCSTRTCRQVTLATKVVPIYKFHQPEICHGIQLIYINNFNWNPEVLKKFAKTPKNYDFFDPTCAKMGSP